MKFKILILLSLCGMASAFAQNTLNISVNDSHSDEPLIGVTAILEPLEIGTISDEKGDIHLENIPNGTFTLQLSYIGYATIEKTLTFPLNQPSQKMVFEMVPQAE